MSTKPENLLKIGPVHSQIVDPKETVENENKKQTNK